MPSILGDSLLALLALVLAFAMGFAIRRGSICLVEASAQWIVRGRTRRIRAFVVCGAAAGCVILPLAWLLPGDSELARAFPITLMTLGMGAAFGLGARLNGGCAFGTINRLSGGQLPYLGTLAGSAAGATLGASILPAATAMPPLFDRPNLIGLAALALFALLALPALRPRHWRGLRALFVRHDARLRPLTAMLLIGTAGAVLYAFAGSWTLFSVLGQQGRYLSGQAMGSSEIKALAGAFALLGGALFAAILSGRFAIRWGSPRQWLQHLTGGTIMGYSAAAIPGGNGALLVFAMPSGAPSAWAAYAAMMLALVVSFLPLRYHRRSERALV